MNIETLESVKTKRKAIQELNDQIEQMYNSVHSPSFGNPHSSNKSLSDPTAETAFRIMKEKRRLDAMIEDYYKTILCIEKWFDHVDDSKTRCIIRWRFLDCLSWKEVSKKAIGDHATVKASRNYMIRYFEKHSGLLDISI